MALAFLALEGGGHLLLESGAGALLLEGSTPDAPTASSGIIKRRRRASQIEGGMNLPFYDDSPRKKLRARHNAVVMVLLH